MNKQGDKTNPSGGIEWTHIFGPGTGYTANPVRGCQHQCRWRFGQDGSIIIGCYAKAQKERLHGEGSFELVTFHAEVLDAIRRHQQPAGIFIDSMSDLFAQAVNALWLRTVFQVMRECPRHIFFSLTKNPSRFQPASSCAEVLYYPRNLFLGVSMPPTFMFGKELTPAQQRTWFDKALERLCATDARVKWVSLEPLSWDCSDLLAKYRDKLHWAVIGAASDGAKKYQPDPETLRRTLRALGPDCPVFFKGNLRNSFTPDPGYWRQEFPKTL